MGMKGFFNWFISCKLNDKFIFKFRVSFGFMVVVIVESLFGEILLVERVFCIIRWIFFLWSCWVIGGIILFVLKEIKKKIVFYNFKIVKIEEEKLYITVEGMFLN